MLAVGGTDPLSGAGVVADALSLAECGAHPLTVATATVDQDSTRVRGYAPLDVDWFVRSLDAALVDGRPDAVKVGMVGDVALATALADRLDAHLADGTPVVVDPVLSGGAGDGRAAFGDGGIYRPLVALAGRLRVVLTPNADELGALTASDTPFDIEGLRRAAVALARRTAAAVLAKGGHIEPPGVDVAVFHGEVRVLGAAPGPADDVHGTGCRLASALAAAMADGDDFFAAVDAARRFMADSFARRTARIGAGRPQFVPAAAVLRGRDRSVREPVPRPDRASEES